MVLVHKINDLRGNVRDIEAVKEVLHEAERTSKRGSQFSGHYRVTSTEEVRINLYNPDGMAPDVFMTPPLGSKLYRHSSGLILLGKTESGRPYQIDFGAKKEIEKYEVDENSMRPLADCLTEDSFSCSSKDSPQLLKRLSTMQGVFGEFFRVDNSGNEKLSVEYKEDSPAIYFIIQNTERGLPLIEHVHENGCRVGELYHKPLESLSMTKNSFIGGYIEEQLLFEDKN
jgi:hypothetical protein